MARMLAIVCVLFVTGTATAQVPDLSGKWSGYWVSDRSGHTGPLHGRFRQVGGNAYRVTYTGRFWVVFPFRYTTTMQVVGAGDGVVQLAASRNLGPGLGTFTTLATATHSSFDATFAARRDTGRFVMTRRR